MQGRVGLRRDVRHGRADARARGRAGDRHVVCLARALRRRRHARCHTHRIQRAGIEPAPPSRCAGGRSRDARPQPIDHSRRQPEQRVAAHECGMPIRGPHKVTSTSTHVSTTHTSLCWVCREATALGPCNERSRALGSFFCARKSKLFRIYCRSQSNGTEKEREVSAAQPMPSNPLVITRAQPSASLRRS